MAGGPNEVCIRNRPLGDPGADLPLTIALMGPTASGKTDLAIALAEALDLAVLSIDSRQLYRGMDVGTAKPTAAQRARVRHELLDLRDPDQPINLQEFVLLARQAIAEEHRRRGVALLVGGSGLYLEALVRGLTPPAVPPQPVLRAQLQSLGQPLCHGLLMQADPEAGRRIAAADAVRTQRALEVIYATGRPRSSQGGHQPPPWRVLELGLDPGDLSERIARRTRAMYAAGLIEETEALLKRFGADCPLLRTMGYDEARRLLAGELEPEEAIALTTLRTRRYAKRQRTWFRGHHHPLWLVGAPKARGSAAIAGRTSAAPDRDPKDRSIRQESPAGSQPHRRSAMQAIASKQIHRSDPIAAAAQHRAAARDMTSAQDTASAKDIPSAQNMTSAREKAWATTVASAQGVGLAQEGVGSELGPASTRDGASDRPMRADPERPTDQRGGQDRAPDQACCDPGSGLDRAVSPDADKHRALEMDAQGGDGGEVLRKILQVAHRVLG